MELEHTPGPWKHEFGVVYITLENGCRKVIAKSSHSDSCLIAAAPEMLHALIDALDTIKYVREYVAGQGLSAEEDCDESIKIIQHAIERATGNTIDEVIK